MGWFSKVKSLFSGKPQVSVTIKDKVEPVNRFSSASLSRINSGLERIAGERNKQLVIESTREGRPTFYTHPTKSIEEMKGNRYSFDQRTGEIYKLNVLDRNSFDNLSLEEMSSYSSRRINGEEYMVNDSSVSEGFRGRNVVKLSANELRILKNRKINEMYKLIDEVSSSARILDEDGLGKLHSRLEAFYDSIEFLELEKSDQRLLYKAIGKLEDIRDGKTTRTDSLATA